MSYVGHWGRASEELDQAEKIKKQTNGIQAQSIIYAYRALWALLMAREVIGRDISQTASVTLINTALIAAQQALTFADEFSHSEFVLKRDYVRAYWLLGAAQRMKTDWTAADTHLTKALTLCRSNNTVEAEADILLDMARLRLAQGKRTEGRRLAEEALMITERSGYVLQGADVQLFFAWLAFAEGKRDEARHHASQARALARCDGPPDYTYKVAYEEAGRLLARLGA